METNQGLGKDAQLTVPDPTAEISSLGVDCLEAIPDP